MNYQISITDTIINEDFYSDSTTFNLNPDKSFFFFSFDTVAQVN